MKLHLGCGQYYLDGYVNIDYPDSEQSVQSNVKVDLYSDLLALKYSSSSIEEIRSHHVFEHFERSIACALLTSWNSWLVDGGILRIEVPDFEKCMKAILNPFKEQHKKSIAMRHIFGSQEAHWAIHYHGYTKKNMKEMMELFGFEITNVNQFEWNGLYNLDITAKKVKVLSVSACREMTEVYLNQFMVDQSESEMDQLKIWMTKYDSYFINQEFV